MRISLLPAITLVVSALSGCGPGAKISGKEGAAQALFAAAGPTTKGPVGAGIDLPISISFSCPQGGKATLGGFQISTGEGAQQSFDIGYTDCGAAKADVGVAVFNGQLKLEQRAVIGSGAVTLSQKFAGRILVQGAFDDFLEADVTQTVELGALGSSNTTVSVLMNGTITTSTETYAYDGALDIAAGTITASVTKRD